MGKIHFYVLGGDGVWHYWKSMHEDNGITTGREYGSKIELSENELVVSAKVSKYGTIYPVGLVYVYDIIAPSFTSITEYEIEWDLVVFPNPVSKVLYINSDRVVSSIKIFNSTGQLVLSQNFQYPVYRSEIMLSHLKPNVYFLNITSEKSQTIKKIIVQ